MMSGFIMQHQYQYHRHTKCTATPTFSNATMPILLAILKLSQYKQLHIGSLMQGCYSAADRTLSPRSDDNVLAKMKTDMIVQQLHARSHYDIAALDFSKFAFRLEKLSPADTHGDTGRRRRRKLLLFLLFAHRLG